MVKVQPGEGAGPGSPESEKYALPSRASGTGSKKKNRKNLCGHAVICFKHTMRQLQCNIWNRSIKIIGERFGASVRGFMLFIRTLFWMNFTLAVVWGVILQISQLITFSQTDVDWTAFLIGLFTGTGLERSWFFFSGYGAYSMPVNLTNNATHGLGVQYAKPAGLGLGMPDSVVTTDVWYLGLATFSMIYSLYFALHAILGHFGHEHDPPIGSNQYEAGRAVFDAWDFALSDKQAAEDNLAKIGGALKVLVDVRAELAVTGTKTWKACFIFYFRKAVGLTLSLCLVLGSAFIIGYSLVRAQTVQKMAIDAAPQIAPFSEFLFPVTLAIINGMVPPLCKIFVKIEKWDNATEVSQLILRVWVIKLLNLLITFATSYTQVGDPEVIRDKYIAGEFTLEQAESYLCKEDFLGMLLWKMAITDMVTQILTHSVALRLLFCYKVSVSGSKKKLAKLRQSMKVAAFCREVGLAFGTAKEQEASTAVCENFVAHEHNGVAKESTDDKEWVCEDAVEKAIEADLAVDNEQFRAASSSGRASGEGQGSGCGEGFGAGSQSADGLGKGAGSSDDDDDDNDNDDDDQEEFSLSKKGSEKGSDGDQESALEQFYGSTHDCLDYYQLAKDKSIVMCKTEFDVPTNIINLMYQQCLIWSGFTMAPFLFSLGLVGFTLQFYVQNSALLVRSKAPKSATVGSLYFRFLLATWCFALIPNIFLVISSPSQYCGPFSLASNSNLPPTASVYMAFHYWFKTSATTSSTFVQEYYNSVSYFLFNAVVMIGFIGCCCITGMFYRADGAQLRRIRHKSNNMVNHLEEERNKTMKKVKKWCIEDGGQNPHVIPGLVDEIVFYVQPLDKIVEDKTELKVAPFPSQRPGDPEIRGSGMDAEIVSSFWMWRTGRAAPHEEFTHEVMTLAHPYSEIAFADSSDSEDEFSD